ncbi:hypothetical protein CONPUDRAFT_155537 [Coniophora puteana RWD-64-598 SS2]|uniref:DUF6532 domain-containing protein n=1 Tax=Coniophora puteana (strain RWD-64-598) TaxID=741705 RepID=A0A5M3MHV6_CONPW|nr:uncharacterized protein CONPUDRAFT_155537 [Coniophora puteana RWD-64-598 SS2]EIW78818.1 hypothetical protein CONPUDRAFT_155537 [Coniophora puteana RWD-64-598 SS2]
MSSRITRASNADKHPGDIVKAFNRRTTEEVELQKKQKRAAQDKKDADLKRSQRRVADMENELAKKRAREVAHAPVAPAIPALKQKVNPHAAAATAVNSNNSDIDRAVSNVPSGTKTKGKKSNATSGSTNDGKTKAMPKTAKPKPRQSKVPLAIDDGADESDGAEEAVNDIDKSAPKPVARKPGKKAAKKTINGGEDSAKANSGLEIEEPLKVVRRSVAQKATFRNGVDTTRIEAQSKTGAEIPVVAAKGKSGAPTTRAIGFKTDVKKWSASVAARGPPASVSTTSRSRNFLTSAKSSTLAPQSITTSKSVQPGPKATSKPKPTQKQHHPEPEPELPNEDEDGGFGLSEDNAEDLARERASIRTQAGGRDVVELSSPPPSPSPDLEVSSSDSPLSLPRPFTQVPREHLPSPPEDVTSPLERLSPVSEDITSPSEHHVSSRPNKRRRVESGDEEDDQGEQAELNVEQDEEHDEDAAPDSKPEIQPAAKPKPRTTNMADVEIQAAKRLKNISGKAVVTKPEKAACAGKDTVANSAKNDDAADKSKDSSKHKKKHSKDTLPAHARNNNRWARVFIPTFLAWLACQKEVWGPSNKKVLAALRNVWHAVYNEDLPSEQDSIRGAVFTLCKQRANEWRSNFGSTATSVLSLSFADEGMFGNDEAESQRTEYAAGLLVGNAFMYENVPEDGSKPSGNFRSPLYASVLATHRAAIRGRIRVPEYDDEQDDYVPRGALTLACAATERACQLGSNNQLGDLESVVEDLVTFQASGSSGCPILKAKSLLQTHSKGRKQVNERTGKPSTTLGNFSEANWKWATDLYWSSIERMGDNYLADAFKATEAHARSLKRGDEDEEMDDVAHSDPRAMLEENCNILLRFSYTY